VTKNKKVIAIVGPTASGKTSIGVKLAREFDGEIVSADSRQVYRGLDLGTGKDLNEYDGVKYQMIDIVDPMEKMTLFDYLPLARAAINDIHSRGKLPIIVGGTGLYVQGLVEGFELVQVSRGLSKKYSREKLNTLTLQKLNEILERVDPKGFQRVDKKNKHRVIRAIEIAQEGLKATRTKPGFEVLQIGIDVPRKELHERIDRRVDERFKEGMLEETQKMLGQGVSPEWLLSLGLEYKVMTSFLLKMAQLFNCSIVDLPPKSNESVKQYNNEFKLMKQQLKWRIHQFARRQMTWFGRFPEINWLSDYAEIKRFVKIFLEH
jgi:tRNA dimethylallyltransferase